MTSQTSHCTKRLKLLEASADAFRFRLKRLRA